MQSLCTASLGAAIVLAGAAAAAAQSPLPPAVMDGMTITLEEIRANSAATYDAIAGGPGPISKAEFTATDLPPRVGPPGQNPELLERLFENLDVNGDDQLTRAEWNQRLERDLGFADQNGDGKVSLTELANARENMSFGDAVGMVF